MEFLVQGGGGEPVHARSLEDTLEAGSGEEIGRVGHGRDA